MPITVEHVDFISIPTRDVAFEGDISDTTVCHMAFLEDLDGNSLMLHKRNAPVA